MFFQPEDLCILSIIITRMKKVKGIAFNHLQHVRQRTLKCLLDKQEPRSLILKPSTEVSSGLCCQTHCRYPPSSSSSRQRCGICCAQALQLTPALSSPSTWPMRNIPETLSMSLWSIIRPPFRCQSRTLQLLCTSASTVSSWGGNGATLSAASPWM